jgi:hypothetical protein
MPKTHKALRSNALPTPVEIYEVDGIALSEEELKLAKLLRDKLARTATSTVIDLNRASKRGLLPHRSRKISR